VIPVVISVLISASISSALATDDPVVFVVRVAIG